MINQILVDGVWVDGDPIEEGQVYRVKIQSRNGFGYQQLTHSTASDVEPIRYITVRAFMQRLLKSERIALRASTDDNVIDALEDLRMAAYVDLADSGLAIGLTYLSTLGLIAVERIGLILADGTESEKYRGVL